MERIEMLDDFFDFKSKEPVNRLAYTEEDLMYKLKVIRKMQELGMAITVDKIGNICGTVKLGENPKKTLVIGSHTDSVYNGGQYDGPIGVVVGLSTAEELIKNKDMNGILKVVIYACEESSRFGNACLGSKYLNGNVKESDFGNIFDRKALDNGEKITLAESVEYAHNFLMENVEGIESVDKIFEQVDYALEAHIEQYEILHKQWNKTKNDIIGIVNSVGSAVRVKYDVKGESGHTGSTPMDKRKNAVYGAAVIAKKIEKFGRKMEESGLGRASQVETNTIGHGGSFNQIPSQAQGLIDFRLLGENTPEIVLDRFEKIIKKAEKKSRTDISYEVVSKGIPAVMSKDLNETISGICNMGHIDYFNMPSYAGQDTGYTPAKEKTMIFIPSTGGSHNPKEKAKRHDIEVACSVFEKAARELLQERFKDKYVQDVSGKKSDKGKSKKREKEEYQL